MRRNTLKLMACACVMALGVATTPSETFAQAEDVPVTLTTTSGITVVAVSSMDFGSWLLLHDTVNDIAMVMDPFLDTVVATPAGGTSSAVEIVASATIGALTIQTPAVATVNMYGTITDFTDGGLGLSTPTFSLNAGPSTTLSVAVGAQTAFTSTGGVADAIQFGGTVAVTATPADAAHTANMNVIFSY